MQLNVTVVWWNRADVLAVTGQDDDGRDEEVSCRLMLLKQRSAAR